MNNHHHTGKPHKRPSPGRGAGAGNPANALLDEFAHTVTSTVRLAVLDWLDGHRAEVLAAVRSNSQFESELRPLPYHRFSLRLAKALRSMNAVTFGDVVTIGKDELLRSKALGFTSVRELEGILHEYGVPTDKWDYRS